MFFRKAKSLEFNRIEPTIESVNNDKIEIVVDKLQKGINNWVATVLPSLTKEFNQKELEILANRLGQEFK